MFNVKGIQPSSYIQWINHRLRFDGASLSEIEQKNFTHPQGDYSELNRYIEYFDSLMSQYCANEVYSIHFDYSHDTDMDFLSVKYIPDNFYFHSQGVSYLFMHDAHIHQRELIKLFQHMIHQIEHVYQANPLLCDGKVSFFTMSLRENSGSIPGIFLFPLGTFPRSVFCLQNLSEQLHFFSPYSEIKIFLCSYPEDNQKFELKIRLHSSKTIGGYCIANSSITIPPEAVAMIHFKAEVLDHYLELALQGFILTINTLPDYQKAQNKVNLYHRLEHTLMANHDNHYNIDNSASPELKI